jgi:hypothetical protein
MIPFIGFIGPYIFGYEFRSYDKDLADLEEIIHETSNCSESGDGFAEAHFDENAGGRMSEDVINDVELVGMEVLFVHGSSE